MKVNSSCFDNLSVEEYDTLRQAGKKSWTTVNAPASEKSVDFIRKNADFPSRACSTEKISSLMVFREIPMISRQ